MYCTVSIVSFVNDFRTVVACLVLTNTFEVIFSAKSGEDGGGLELAIQ